MLCVASTEGKILHSRSAIKEHAQAASSFGCTYCRSTSSEHAEQSPGDGHHEGEALSLVQPSKSRHDVHCWSFNEQCTMQEQGTTASVVGH